MAESLHTQILEAVKTVLKGIVEDAGESYWYTPTAVIACEAWDGVPDPSVGDQVLAIRAGEERHTEETSGTVKAEAEVFILAIRKSDSADLSPYSGDTSTRLREKDRMVRDVLRALWANPTLKIGTADALVNNVCQDSLFVNRDMFVEGDAWVVAEMRFTVVYTYPKATP